MEGGRRRGSGASDACDGDMARLHVAPWMLIDVQGARKVPVRCIQT